MNLTLSQNMIYYTLIIIIVGKALKPLITKNRKVILPIILMIFGGALAFGVNYFNGSPALIGNTILQGIISSLVAQYSFDKIRDIITKGVDIE